MVVLQVGKKIQCESYRSINEAAAKLSFAVRLEYRGGMEILFECSTRYLTSKSSERIRYRLEHEKRNSISPSEHVLFCLLYKHLINKEKSILLTLKKKTSFVRVCFPQSRPRFSLLSIPWNGRQGRGRSETLQCDAFSLMSICNGFIETSNYERF